RDGFGSMEEVDFPFEAVESILKYRFRNRALLIEAFTHQTFGQPVTPSYQRLEFLGDAILDWVITRMFYNSYPDLAPGALTDLRQAAVNNESYSRMSVKLKLYPYLLHGLPIMAREIEEYVGYIESAGDGLHPTETKHEGPKVLGDLFEAVAGAVFVDAEGHLPTMWNVFKPLMSDFLEVHANPDVAQKSPIRKFHEHFQKMGFAVNDVHYRFAMWMHHTHGAFFVCRVYVLDFAIATEVANSKTLAKRLVSIAGLKWIEDNAAKIEELLHRSLGARKEGVVIDAGDDEIVPPLDWKPSVKQTQVKEPVQKALIVMNGFPSNAMMTPVMNPFGMAQPMTMNNAFQQINAIQQYQLQQLQQLYQQTQQTQQLQQLQQRLDVETQQSGSAMETGEVDE
ncbi:hypothetical protein HK097_000909, partial [Rhizophlyctis rosea]